MLHLKTIGLLTMVPAEVDGLSFASDLGGKQKS